MQFFVVVVVVKLAIFRHASVGFDKQNIKVILNAGILTWIISHLVAAFVCVSVCVCVCVCVRVCVRVSVCVRAFYENKESAGTCIIYLTLFDTIRTNYYKSCKTKKCG